MRSQRTITILGILVLIAIVTTVSCDPKIIDILRAKDSNSENCCNPEEDRSQVLYDKAEYLNELNRRDDSPIKESNNRERGTINQILIDRTKKGKEKPYPYAIVDTCRTIAHPCELVVEIPEAESAKERAIREKYLKGKKLIKKDSCSCRLELWALPDCDPQGSGVNDILTAANSDDDSGVQSIGFNSYVFGYILPTGKPRSENGRSAEVAENQSIIDVAILDTGLDPNHSDYNSHVYWPDNINNCEDKNANRDYVNQLDQIYDDNGHGTHVAGIIANNLLDKNFTNFRLIPYKTHDENGMSTVFKLTCAMYQAMDDNVKVVNLSCGYYGDNPVFNKALKNAKNKKIIVVNSAGNDGKDVSEIGFYPASRAIENKFLISVGAHRNLKLVYQGRTSYISSFSNMGNVEIAAQGNNIRSSWPQEGEKCLSGTSMSAPAVTSRVIQLLDNVPPDYVEDALLTGAFSQQDPDLLDYVIGGRQLVGSSYLHITCETIPSNVQDGF